MKRIKAEIKKYKKKKKKKKARFFFVLYKVKFGEQRTHMHVESLRQIGGEPRSTTKSTLVVR
jgi:hypothetical protein